MKVFKGFTEELTATHGKGTYKYELGKTYREEKSKTRSTGFHAAEYIMDCLTWYPINGKNRFFLCEAGGSIDEEESCSMVVSTELTLEKELNKTEIAFYAMQYMINHPKRAWEADGNGASVRKDKAMATQRCKIAIARGTHPVVWGDIGTVIGLILENKQGEIVAAGLQVAGVTVDACTNYTITSKKEFVEVKNETESN